MEINPDTLEIEIVGIEPIDGGVQVFARAWSDGVQIGFGKDGTVDIERFRIFNPPVLVDDPNGDIHIVSPEKILEDGTKIPETTRTLREDCEQALIFSLSSIISTMKNVHGETLIEKNKIGNTTTTVYAGAGDGDVGNETESTFSTVRNAATGTAAQYTTDIFTRVYQRTTSLYRINRGYLPFDTTAIGADQIISSAVLKITPKSLTNVNGNTTDGTIVIYGNQGNNTTLTTSDYQPYSFSAISSKINYSSQVVNTELSFTLSDTSRINLSGSVFTKLCITTSNDQANSISWGSGERYMYYIYYGSEEAGTTKDPNLVIEHSAGGGAPAFIPRGVWLN